MELLAISTDHLLTDDSNELEEAGVMKLANIILD